MTRRGRPRKSGQRYKSGKLKPESTPRDAGTPELYEKRRIIVGEKGNPNLSTCPLDALLARDLISQDIYNDASDYRRWYTLAVRRPVPSAPGGAIGGDDIDDSKIADATRKFREAASVLMKVSRSVKDAVDNCVVYERWPGILLDRTPRKSDQHLFDGLAVLSKWRRRGERRAA